MDILLSQFDFLLIAGYFIIVLLIGYFSSRGGDKESYLIADRKVGVLPLAASLCAGLVGGGVLITTTALAYKYGLSFMWLYIGAALGFFLFPIIGKKIKTIADEKKFYTLSDYFSNLYSRKTTLLSVVIIFIIFFSFIVLQFIAGGRLLASISGFPYYVSVLVMGIIVLIYLLLGGFKAVIKTDYFQYILMFFLAIIVLFSFSNFKISSSQFNIFSIGIVQIIGFTLLGVFTIFAAADVWQRAYASKSKKALKKSFYLAGLLLLLFGFFIGLIGIHTQNNFPGIRADDALFFGFSNLLPSGVFGLGLVLLFASIMSSLDTVAFVAALNISRDLLRTKNIERVTKYVLVGLVVVGILFALFIQSIVDVMFALMSLNLALAPVLISSFYWRLKDKAVFLSLLMGLLSVLFLLIVGALTIETAVVSLPVSFVFLLFGQLVWRRESSKALNLSNR